MWILAFLAQSCTLGNPKPVLLIYYSQLEILEGDRVLYESMCAYQDLNRSIVTASGNCFSVRRRGITG